jgi:DNA-binding NarL/FixJ family response regulator
VALLLQTYGRFDAVSVESFGRAGRVLAGGGGDAVLWVGDELTVEVVEAATELRHNHSELGICLLAVRGDPGVVAALLMDRADRLAVLLRTPRLEIHDVIAALRCVINGASVLEPHSLKRLLGSGHPSDDPLRRLTACEREILALISQGLRNREIARRLWKSEKAVEKHVSNVFMKLGLGPEAMPHLDRRVTATRIYLSEEPSDMRASSHL